MGLAIGDILPLAVGVAISPVPIIAIVLILGTPRARSNGPAFALGWLAGLSIAGGIFLAVRERARPRGGRRPGDVGQRRQADPRGALRLAGGPDLAWRPQAGQEAEMPKWMRAIDRFTAVRSLVFGVILSALNPKNLASTA
jgi:hypothetical protein